MAKEIKVGDRIAIRRRLSERFGGGFKLINILPVTRVTPKAFWIGSTKVRLDASDPHYALATAEECAAWGENLASKARGRKEQEEAYRVRQEHKRTLTELFSPRYRNIATVGDHGSDHERFDVTFHDLTEQQVRDLADKLKG